MTRPEQEELREAVHRVLAKELAPFIEESQKTGQFCLSAYRALARAGLLSPMFPDSHGGIGSVVAQVVVAEEMGYFDAGFGLSTLASVCLFGANVARHGTAEQRDRFLWPLASGEKLGCWALTEPQVGSDALAVQTTAVKKGDRYVVRGSKTFITNAPLADYFLVLAREVDSEGKPVATGIKGGLAFILEKGMAGLSVGSPFHKHGHLSSPTGEVFMDQVEVPENLLLGERGRAFYDMKYSLDVERVVFSGLATGMMRFCLKTAVDYSASRRQMGQPIGAFQMVQDKIAMMATWYETARCFLYQTADDLAAGQSVNKNASIVKLIAAQNARLVADAAVQCLGGYGYMTEYQVERYLRDAKLFEIGGGTSEIQKLIIAKQVFKEYGHEI